ncbi:MAG TPA: SDR family NAD(P)-dependent oxidoreductase [Myxococcaceae bacterium]|nr:SDR family NAD(P)-dependent oxidoreductase [Myxococcaceae bacterium]
MGRRILVTGAAGFIGSHTVEAFLERGDHVLGLDSFDSYYDPARKHANVAELRARPEAGRLLFVEGDVRDDTLLRRLYSEWRPEVVVHLAAVAGVRASIAQPQLYFDVNVNGTLAILEAAREFGVGHVVLASTSSVYGNSVRLPFDEDDSADRPLNPYAASKRAAEMLGHSYHHLYGIHFTALRFFTVYGPRNRPDMMAYKVADSIFTGQELPLYEAGQMYRDWTYVSDTVAGVVAAADHRVGFEVINLGRGEPVLLLDFVRRIEELAGRRARFVSQPKLGSDASATHADIGKARQLLGYAPKVSFPDGVMRFWGWYQRQRSGIHHRTRKSA